MISPIYGGGRKPSNFEKYIQILDCDKYNRQLEIAFTVRALVGFEISINEDFQNKKIKLWYFGLIGLWKETILHSEYLQILDKKFFERGKTTNKIFKRNIS